IRIHPSAPASFSATVETIGLTINEEPIGIRRLGGDAYFPALTTRTGQVFELDIRNASGVAVTPDLEYAFVGDWYIPRLYYMNPDIALEIEELHEVGSKVAIVKDPFGP